MIRARIHKKLREFALDVDVTFPRGVTVLTGPSGAGKSTLLRVVAGLERCDHGEISIDDHVLERDGTRIPAFRRELAYVFQEYALFPHLDVIDNVGYGLAARGVSRRERDERARGWLARLELGALAHARPGALSGGERQRVALARALARTPRALMLDEPFAALDPGTRKRVRAEVGAMLGELDIPVILVSHDEGDEAAFSAPVIRLVRGRVVR